MSSRNVWGQFAKSTTLRPSARGSNKRGTCLHKRTRGARRAKGQITTGYAPREL